MKRTIKKLVSVLMVCTLLLTGSVCMTSAAPLKKLDYPVFEINEREKQLISNGGKISLVSKDGITILTCNGSIVAIGKVLGGIFKPDKVFI